jgi:alkylhydroperoxidase family enzyme
MRFSKAPAGFPYPWYLRLMFWLRRRRHGRELEPVRLWARIPVAFFAMNAMYRALDRKSSPIDPGLRSLVQVRVSQINACEFCTDLNAFVGIGRGIADEKIGALPQFEHSPLFSKQEKSALRFTEAVTRSDRRIDPGLLAELRVHFDEQAAVELAALVAFQNMSSKFNAALCVPAAGFCRTVPQRRGRGEGDEFDLAHRKG